MLSRRPEIQKIRCEIFMIPFENQLIINSKLIVIMKIEKLKIILKNEEKHTNYKAAVLY